MGTRKIYIISAILLATIVSAFAISQAYERGTKKTERKMMKNSTTVCVGRFLIDFPEGAEVSFPPARVGGITIDSWSDYNLSDLQADLNEAKDTMAQKKNEYNGPNLEKTVVEKAINFDVTLLYYNRERPQFRVEYGKRIEGTEQAISIAGYATTGDFGYRFQADHFASPRYDNSVVNLLKKFEARAPSAIPSQPGFCTRHGFIHDPISPTAHESATVFASLKGHPDVAIRFDTLVNADKIFESVLSRDANNDVKLNHPTAFTTFQSRARTLNGIEGEEVLDKVKEANGTSAHIFMWASMGKKHDVLAPKITLELETGIGRPGEQINSSLSDKEVLELWEQISSSIRLRPVSAADKSRDTHAPDQSPLGTLVSTGRVCPQSGYWESSEAGEILGGHRQFLRAGEAMPEAVWLGRPSVLQRLRSERPSYRTVTVWKLAAYAATNNVANAAAGMTNGDDSAPGRDSADGQAPPFPTPPESGTA